jgi:hypothetical protein
MQQPAPPQDAVADLREKYASLFSTPELLPWQLDIPGARMLLARISESGYRDAVFLDQRLNLDGKLQAIWAPLERLLADGHATGPASRPARFIFHVGHCGSTLLSRLLAENPDLLPLREPSSLRTLAESERQSGGPHAPMGRHELQDLMQLLLRLLARVYHSSQHALIKPSSNCNNLISPLLASDPEHKAVFLYLNLRSYLASILRPQSRGALQAFSKERAFDLHHLLPDAGIVLGSLPPARMGAANWLTSMAYLAQAQSDARLFTRIRIVEFESFLKGPDDILTDLFLFFDHPVTHGTVTTILQGKHMVTYAKDQRVGYTPELRAADLEQSMQTHRADIEDAQDWIMSLLDRSPGLAALKGLII